MKFNQKDQSGRPWPKLYMSLLKKFSKIRYVTRNETKFAPNQIYFDWFGLFFLYTDVVSHFFLNTFGSVFDEIVPFQSSKNLKKKERNRLFWEVCLYRFDLFPHKNILVLLWSDLVRGQKNLLFLTNFVFCFQKATISFPSITHTLLIELARIFETSSEKHKSVL